MTSSQSARLILLALWFVATLLLTSAQLRVIAVEPPRRWRYVVAWIGCTLIGGALLSMVDNAVGRADWGRRIANTVLSAAVAAVALGTGAWVTQRPEWLKRHGVVRFLTLLLLQAVVILIVAYTFI